MKKQARAEWERAKRVEGMCVDCGIKPTFRRSVCAYHWARRNLRPKFKRYIVEMGDDEAFLEAASRLVERVVTEPGGKS